MITEVEGPEGSAGPWKTADVVRADRTGDRWPWMLGTAVATSALWALVLGGSDHHRSSAPDLHGYHLTDSPCAGFTLKPLTDAMKVSAYSASTAEMRTGSALDQAQCDLRAAAPDGDDWMATYQVTVTVELHKKTDPAPEFEDRNRRDGPDLGFPGVGPGNGQTDRVEAVHDLGDAAYLLTGNSQEQALTVRHGGAVLTIDLLATEQWVGSGDMPADSSGYPQQPPSLAHFHPALAATMRSLMTVLST